MAIDPTREEMLEHLKSVDNEADEFDVEEAIYWYAADYHGGQWTNVYRALCASPYKPGPCRGGPDDSALHLYEALIDQYE